MPRKPKTFIHPFDNTLAGAFRFGSELLAWITGPWALSKYSVWLSFPALVFLILIPSIFSVRGDKNLVAVATPGPIRAAIELGLYSVAAGACWYVWPPSASIIADVMVILAIVFGLPRIQWLISGAEMPSTDDRSGEAPSRDSSTYD